MAKLGMYNVVVKAVVFNKNKVLLLKRTSQDKFEPGSWDLPGGKLEHEEIPEPGLHREILEEAGIKVKLLTPFNSFYWYSKEEKVHKVAINYIANYKSGKVKTSIEHEFAKWFDIDKIPKEVSPWVVAAVKKADKIRKFCRN